MKKGQVALFVIISIIIIAGIFIFLSVQKPVSVEQPSIKPISSYIEECIKSTGEDALIFVGQQGGFYELPKNSIDSYPYYFYNNKSYLPSKETVEKQISLYINEMLPFCTKNFVDFPDFYTESRAVDTETVILENKVRFNVAYPVIAKKGGTIYSLEEFSAEIPSRLDVIYSAAESMISAQVENPASICLSCMINIGIANDIYIDMENYGDDAVLFTITDKNIMIKGLPYEFTFANQY